MPGRPIRPVARWQLMIALTLSVPAEDWFTPCEYSVTVALGGGEPVVETTARPQTTGPSRRRLLRADGIESRAASSAASNRLVWRADASRDRRRRRSARVDEQAVEQRDVACRASSARCRSASSQVAVRRGSMTTTRVPRGLPGGREALVQHRMAPRGVAADQHDEVGFVEVLVAARHHVLAEGAHVARDRGGHAQPRVGVDVGRCRRSPSSACWRRNNPR